MSSTAKVAKILDDRSLVINRGISDGVQLGDIYATSGGGRLMVTQVEDRIAMLRTFLTHRVPQSWDAPTLHVAVGDVLTYIPVEYNSYQHDRGEQP